MTDGSRKRGAQVARCSGSSSRRREGAKRDSPSGEYARDQEEFESRQGELRRAAAACETRIVLVPLDGRCLAGQDRALRLTPTLNPSPATSAANAREWAHLRGPRRQPERGNRQPRSRQRAVKTKATGLKKREDAEVSSWYKTPPVTPELSLSVRNPERRPSFANPVSITCSIDDPCLHASWCPYPRVSTSARVCVRVCLKRRSSRVGFRLPGASL
ncbi:hypothetical protein ISCGN_001561 [Ixodes scapularis]